MNRKILRLPESVINQIAAGEVVENPASIVKELIENSLDAEAKRIEVEIVAGGQILIRVEDDGCGMSPEDALLSLERHATSKIRQVEDLQILKTMGFRGEALAAISSVSHFALKTAQEGETGTRIVAEGGQILQREPCARNRGTTVEVGSLFFNVPARKKFQKSAAANTAQVIKVVETLALAHPDLFFSLSSEGKNLLTFPAASRRERVEEVMGELEIAFSLESGAIKIAGFAAAPDKAMATRKAQQVLINRRPIFSPLIARAVKEGFGTRIGEHAYPPFVLFLEIPSDRIDVNVHPQKKEAKFREEGLIFRLVQEAVSSAFIAPFSFAEPLFFTPPPSSPSPFSLQEEPTVPSPFLLSSESPELSFVYADRPLVVCGNYLLLQNAKTILVDLPAARARILFESLKRPEGEKEPLAQPVEIDLIQGEEVLVEELKRMGIECRLLQKKLAIDALPPELEGADFPQFWESWREKKKWEESSLSFCRKSKRVYSLEEAASLWRKLQTCQDSLFDPLGNRIWTELKQEHFKSLLHG